AYAARAGVRAASAPRAAVQARRRMTPAVTCRELVEFLDDYLAGSLPSARVAEFNAHLAQCPSCVAYMKTYETSVALGRAPLAASADPIAEGVPEALVRAILAAREKT